jgi:hypothetical protein
MASEMPDDFEKIIWYKREKSWEMVTDLWAEAERITYENTPVDAEGAAQLREWYHG